MGNLKPVLIIGLFGLAVLAFGIWDLLKEWNKLKKKKENSLVIFLISIPYSFYAILLGLVFIILALLILNNS